MQTYFEKCTQLLRKYWQTQKMKFCVGSSFDSSHYENPSYVAYCWNNKNEVIEEIINIVEVDGQGGMQKWARGYWYISAFGFLSAIADTEIHIWIFEWISTLMPHLRNYNVMWTYQYCQHFPVHRRGYNLKLARRIYKQTLIVYRCIYSFI